MSDDLLCLFDKGDWQYFRATQGPDNRGFYSPVLPRQPYWRKAPDHIRSSVFDGNVPLYQNLIYLYATTCQSEVQFVMTFAHELQHYIQRKTAPELWAANSLIPNLNERSLRDLGLGWCDIPHEREARIVSKRAAIKVFGESRVMAHIEGKLKIADLDRDKNDWICIRDLSYDTPFDLKIETKQFYPRLRDYQTELCCIYKEFRDSWGGFPKIDLQSLLDPN